MDQKGGAEGRYITSREAADRLGYSRPDSFLRAWRGEGLRVFRRPSGRALVREADLPQFVAEDAEGER